MPNLTRQKLGALKRAANEEGGRRQMAQMLPGFCAGYLGHYFTLDSAPMHYEMMRDFSNPNIPMLLENAFRGSAKSTLASVALAAWEALEGISKFIILLSDTNTQAKLNMSNLRSELTENELIVADYGDVRSREEWTASNMLLKNGVRIMSRSRGQKIRGLRHRAQRPDRVIADDVENLESVRTKEQRDKTDMWWRQDVLPAMDESKGRVILLGNLLHMDSLIARAKKDPIWTVREYPLVDAQGNIMWSAKYPDQKALDLQKAKVGSKTWQREYLLKVVAEEGQVIKEGWIKYYDKAPDAATIVARGTGVDLAISKKDTADYTAMVSGKATTESDAPKIYISPNPVNERLSFHETANRAESVSRALSAGGLSTLYVEDVAYQLAAIQEMRRRMLPVKAMKPGTDKRARLEAISGYVEQGTVLFPRHGCEDLIMQLLGFGVEQHDDLVDAFVYLIMGLARQGIKKQEIIWL